MVNGRFLQPFSHLVIRRKFCSISGRTDPEALPLHENFCSGFRARLREKSRTLSPGQTDKSSLCIYKVPSYIREAEPKAYEPNIVSIGPYHHGVEHLRPMEEVKLQFYARLLHSSGAEKAEHLDTIFNAMEDLETEARSCYRDGVNLSRDEFIELMVIDGCFIVQLLRELGRDFGMNHVSKYMSKSMIPILRRDLIMLENQLPFSVISKLFDLTSRETTSSSPSLQQLFFQFLNPVKPGIASYNNNASLEGIEEGKHFLDLLRSRILPKNMARGKEEEMIHSLSRLQHCGVIVEVSKNSRPLDITSQGRILRIPPLYIDDCKGTLFRNLMAYEHCHRSCEPDVINFIFFINGLISSAEDLNILRAKGILRRSLGYNEEVAEVLNKLCKEVPRGAESSYLYKVVRGMNEYQETFFARMRALAASLFVGGSAARLLQKIFVFRRSLVLGLLHQQLRLRAYAYGLFGTSSLGVTGLAGLGFLEDSDNAISSNETGNSDAMLSNINT